MAIFPPDHKPLATPLDALTNRKRVKTFVGAGVLTTAWGIYPGYPDAHTWRHPEDPPVEDYVPVPVPDIVPNAFGSTSANPVFGSIDTTAAQVIRRAYAQRDAQFRVSAFSGSSSPLNWPIAEPDNSLP